MDHLVGGQAAGKIGRVRGQARPRVQAAALPWRRTATGIEIMLVTSRGRRHWVLPKGWPEKNERLCDAAAREAMEEAGLKGSVSKREFGRYGYVKGDAGNGIACEVCVFPLEVSEVAGKWKESGERARRWMGPTEAWASVNDADLRGLIANFFDDTARSAA